MTNLADPQDRVGEVREALEVVLVNALNFAVSHDEREQDVVRLVRALGITVTPRNTLEQRIADTLLSLRERDGAESGEAEPVAWAVVGRDAHPNA